MASLKDSVKDVVVLRNSWKGDPEGSEQPRKLLGGDWTQVDLEEQVRFGQLWNGIDGEEYVKEGMRRNNQVGISERW